MDCRVCGTTIKRGQKFIGDTYKTIPFCSEKCYGVYLYHKRTDPLEKLKSLVNSIYSEPNWPSLMQQADKIKKDYGLTDKDIYDTIRYAIKYENYLPNEDYGLRQFDKFIVPMQSFRNKLLELRENSMQAMGENSLNLIDNPAYVFIPKGKANRIWREKGM